jgi:hypothetical protein
MKRADTLAGLGYDAFAWIFWQETVGRDRCQKKDRAPR